MIPESLHIPKSLHTVTVIARVAADLRDSGRIGREFTDAVAAAIAILGYADASDTYGLADKARAVLAREMQS